MTNEEIIEQLEEFMVIDDWTAVYMPNFQEVLEEVIKKLRKYEHYEEQAKLDNTIENLLKDMEELRKRILSINLPNAKEEQD